MKSMSSGWLSFASSLRLSRLTIAGVLFTSWVCAKADYQSAVLSQSPVGYWRLNETGVVSPVLATNFGTVGAAGHGTHENDIQAGFPGALPAQSATNFAIHGDFFLQGNRVRVPYNGVWNTNGDFSVEFWCKPGQTNILACPAASVEFADPSTNQALRRGWLFYQGQIFADGTDNGNGWIFRLYTTQSGAGGQRVQCVVTNVLDTNKWYHIAGTYKSTTTGQGPNQIPRAMTLYVNGLPVATNSTFPNGGAGAYANVTTNGIPLTFGARADGDFGFFTHTGSIDEGAFYPYLLSSAQVLAHYQAGTNNAPVTPYQTTILSHTPAGYWRFNEKLGPAAANLGSSATAGEYLYSATAGSVGPQPAEFTGFAATNRAVTISTADPVNPGSVRVAPLGINTNTVTIASWIKPNGSQNAYAGIFMNAATDGTYSGLNIGLDGGFQIGYTWNNDASTYDFPSTVTVPDGQWSFVAVTVGPTQAVIYAHDGTAFQTNVNTLPHLEQGFNGLSRIGQDYIYALSSPASVFNGEIDEVAIFKRTLTIGEIYTLYSAGKGGIAPSIFEDVVTPPNLAAGETLLLAVEAGGTPDLSYQWRKNGTPIGGATARTYSKPNVSGADDGNYDVAITNAFGAVTSAVATVSIQGQAAPTIDVQPVGATVYQNGFVNLSVTASGGALEYRWLLGGSLIPDATNASYVISPAEASDAGSYTVIVSNTVNSVLSAPAVVNVIVPAVGTYAAAVVADSPVSWWRLDEAPFSPTFQDAMGRNHGTWTVGPNLGSAGVSAGGTAAYFAGGANAYGEVPFAANLNSQTLTVECWVKTTNALDSLSPVASWAASPNRKGYMFIKEAEEWRTAFSFGDDFIYTYVTMGGLPLDRAERWAHLVFTTSPGDGWSVYYNGVRTAGPFSPAGWVVNSTTPFIIGANVPGASGYNNFFDGVIDEVAVYPTVLSAARVLDHYQTALYGNNTGPIFLSQPISQTVAEGNSVAFSSVVEGTLPLTRQWLKNGSPIPGATNATLTLNSITFSDAASYRLSATNSVGTSNSSPATLTVLGAPTYANVTNNLVLHLKFDGNYLDSTGRGNHGYPSNSPAIITGKVGSGALSYATLELVDTNTMTTNYSSSFVDLGMQPDLQFGTATDFSVAFWAKFTGTPGDLPFFCNTDESLGSEGYTFAPGFNTGSIGWSLDGYRFEGGPNINDNDWHHVVVSIKRTGNAVTYVDGQTVDTRFGSSTDLDSPFNTVIGQTGTYAYQQAGAFQLDDLGVWRRELSAIEAYSIWYVGQTYGRSFDQFGPVLLVVRPNGDNLELIWQSGTLKQADNLGGPWTNVPGASAPYHVVTPTGPQKFYRVQL